MASFIPHLLFLLLLLVTLSPTLLLADDNLIKKQCRHAEAPELCIQCVKSDPRASKADKVGIATIIINCLSNHSKTLAGNMSDLAVHAPNKKLSSAFKNCSQGFEKANKDLAKVVSCLKGRDFDHANRSVRTALQFKLTCRRQLMHYKGKVPSSVEYTMRVYEALSVSAMRIIDRL